MKKRNLFTLMLVALLAFTLGMGTLAYYTKTFASNDNIVKAAKFTVDAKGLLDKGFEFDLTEEPLYPGIKKDLYEFEIDKTGTGVPVEYEVTVTGRDKLFSGKTPVTLNLYKETDGNWTLFEENPITATKDIEKFKIEAVWEHGNNDINYQGADGKVAIKVVATQVDGEPEVPVDPEEPEEPEEPVNPAPAIEASYFKWGVSSYAYVTSVDLEGAVKYEAMNGNKSGGIKAIGKAAPIPGNNLGKLDSYYIRVRDKDSKIIWEGDVLNPTDMGTKNPDPYL